MVQSTFVRKSLIATAQVIVCTTIVVWIIQSSSTDKKDIIVEKILKIKEGVQISNKEPVQSTVEKFRKCSRAANFKAETDKEFILEYRNCVVSSMPKVEWEKFRMGRYGEDKVFAPMKPEFDENECKWLTVGIGGDSQVEKLFHTKYPGCQLFGVEASEDQYAQFKSYGTVIPYGVGVENGTFELTVREGRKYYKKEVQVLAMAELLDAYLGTRKVHYMTIDIEGFEYFILEALIGGQKLSEQGVAFCQIDAELHHQSNSPTYLKEFLKKFDSDESDYIPIFAAPFLKHQKITFLNFKEPECARAFNIELFV